MFENIQLKNCNNFKLMALSEKKLETAKTWIQQLIKVNLIDLRRFQ